MMENNNKTFLIVFVSGLILAIGTIFYFFKISDVPDVDWKKDYSFESDEPYGTSLFYNLLKEKYKSENVLLTKDGFNFSNAIDTSSLYVYMSNDKNYLNQTIKDSILYFADQGNDILIISPISSFSNTVSSSEIEEPYSGYTIEDTSDTIEIYNEDIDTINLQDYIDYENYFVTDYDRDSILHFNLRRNETDTLTYVYKHYRHNFEDAKLTTFKHVIPDSLSITQGLIWYVNNNMIFIRFKNNPNLHFHFTPELFSNAAARQDFYLEHFEYVTNQFNPDRIILDHPFYIPTIVKRGNESPLGYIMTTPTLKWAYFTMLFAFIVYLINGGKRKQREIPIIESQKNTSLEHVKMISQLYQVQNQNEKLVLHIKNNFNHIIKKKYYVDISETEILSKKSGINKKIIERLNSKFESAEKSDFTDEQLFVLQQQIESFLKKCK